ncbi:MAG: lipocalin family protein [Hyphomonadaceae bacterium]
MKQIALVFVLSIAVSGCITSPGPGGAPVPITSVDKARLYTGDWHEIAYRPNWLTQGCVAGITRYTPKDKPNEVGVRDSCREKTVDGKEKVVEGTGYILDPGANAKIRADYFPFVSRETHIVALAPDYSWFISVTPDFGELNIFTRDPQPGDAEITELKARAAAMGYDTSLLYFPPQPPR